MGCSDILNGLEVEGSTGVGSAAFEDARRFHNISMNWGLGRVAGQRRKGSIETTKDERGKEE